MDSHGVVEKALGKLGYRPKKQQIIAVANFISGQDVFVILPTGFGKSLCYQCLPLVFDMIRTDRCEGFHSLYRLEDKVAPHP